MSCWNRFRLACRTSAMTMPLNWENECDYRNCHASDISPISGHFWGYLPSSLLCSVAQRHLATTSGRHIDTSVSVCKRCADCGSLKISIIWQSAIPLKNRRIIYLINVYVERCAPVRYRPATTNKVYNFTRRHHSLHNDTWQGKCLTCAQKQKSWRVASLFVSLYVSY